MKHYKIFGKDIENTFEDLDKHCVLVPKEFGDMLVEMGIKVNKFSDIAKDMVFVKDSRGKKPKKFNYDDMQNIKNDYANGISYRKLSEKYNCSTALIYRILKDKY